MVLTLAVAALCASALLLGLLALACRHQPDGWFASENSVLCFATPIVMIFAALGIGSVAWLVTHWGAGSLTMDAMVSSGIVLASAIVLWRLLAPRMRRTRAPAPVTPPASLVKP